MKNLLTILCLFCVLPAFADEVKDQQKVKVENSYLTSVAAGKDTILNQEVIVRNSFLVFIKVKACACNSALQSRE